MSTIYYNPEQLRNSAKACSSFDEYADDSKFEWIFGIEPSADSSDNSVSSKVRNWLIEHHSTIVNHDSKSGSDGESTKKKGYNDIFIDAIKKTLTDGTNGYNYDEVFPKDKYNYNIIDRILDSQKQLRSIHSREQLIIICFALVSLGGDVDLCDEVMRAASDETVHHRELYQLDAEEGFYRFILYWNSKHRGNDITYYEAKMKLPGFLDRLSASVSQKLDALEAVLTVNSCTETDEAEFAYAVNNISAELNSLKKLLDSAKGNEYSRTFRRTIKKAVDYAEEKAELAVTTQCEDTASLFNAVSPDNLDEAIRIFDSELASVRSLHVMINHYDKILMLGSEIAGLQPDLIGYINQLSNNPDGARNYSVIKDLKKKINKIISKQGVKLADIELPVINDKKLLPPLFSSAKELLDELNYAENALGSIYLSFRLNNYNEELLTNAVNELERLVSMLSELSQTITTQQLRYRNYRDDLETINQDISQRRSILDRLLNIKCFWDSMGIEEQQIREFLKSSDNVEKAGTLYLNANKKAYRRNISDLTNSSALRHGTAACCNEIENLIEEASKNKYDFDTALECYSEKAARFIGEKDWTAVSIIINAVNDSERISTNRKYFQNRIYESASSRVTDGMRPENYDPAVGTVKPRFSHTLDSHAIDPGEIINKGNAAAISKMMNPRLRTDPALIISGSDRSSVVDGIIASCNLINSKNSRLKNGVMTTSRRDLLRFALAVGCNNTTEVENILGLSGDSTFDSFDGREMLVLMLLIYLEKPNIDYKAENYLESVLEAMRRLEEKALLYSAKIASAQKAEELFIKDSVRNLKRILLFPAASIIPRKKGELYLEFAFCFYAAKIAYERFRSAGPSEKESRNDIFATWLDKFEERTVMLKDAYSDAYSVSDRSELTAEYYELRDRIEAFCSELEECGQLIKDAAGLIQSIVIDDIC